MNLLEIRTEFVRKSGRYDLVANDDEGFKDAGADFFIRAGQRMLDRRGDWNTGQRATYYASLAVGEKEVFIPNCWHIISLHWQSGRMKIWEEAELVHDINCAMRCRVPGTLYFSLTPVRDLPLVGRKKASQIDAPASSFEFSSVDAIEEYNTGVRLAFLFAFSRSTRLKVLGNFFSEPLLEDTSTNYWTNRHPEILLKAALYQLEVFYRNTEGAKDWLEAVNLDMRDVAETELLAEVSEPVEMGW